MVRRTHGNTVGRTALATLATTVALALAGCGSTRAADAGSGTTAAAPDTSAPTSSSPQPRHISAELRKLEDTACGSTTPRPSAEETTSAPPTEPVGDQPPNYADNNAYRQTLPLEGLAVCRGEVHVERLTEKLKDVPVDKARVDTELSRLGYGYEVDEIQADDEPDDTVRFVIGLDGVCLTGTLVPGHGDTIEAHGPYMEGGCVEPAYGH
ncbi:hypothetical protein AB0I77_07625 [Streptomyces sp. NPDC050619]|uniref:hypothetical protein n=1 Tax=Streptomyces sp. NPDC050619 TaxID=3157214 RepID=UPI0034206E77